MSKDIDFSEFQSVAKDVLCRVKKFCEENSLRYWLAYGTLLGAVRHNDIIPWDYDIDIYMPRKDLNKFLELTTSGNNPIENTEIFSWTNRKEHTLPFVKVCDSRTRLVIKKTVNPLPYGIWVDIFPLDGAPPETEDLKALHELICTYVGKAAAPYALVGSPKEKAYRALARLKSVSCPSTEYIKKVSELASRYDYETSEKVGVIGSIDLPIEREIFPRKFVEETVMIKFGDEEFACPAGYDEILKNDYGDYMQLPPEEDRKIPTINSYWI